MDRLSLDLWVNVMYEKTARLRLWFAVSFVGTLVLGVTSSYGAERDAADLAVPVFGPLPIE